MWDPDEVDWWLEVFDDATEQLVVETPLTTITEAEVRAHFAIPDDVEAIDGLEVRPSDIEWLSQFVQHPLVLDLSHRTAYIGVNAKPDG